MSKAISPNKYEVIDGTLYLYITGGHTVLMDAEDEDVIRGTRWYASYETFNGVKKYKGIRRSTHKGTQYLHRAILEKYGIIDDLQVDHKDRNIFNNKKENLRTATPTENLSNRRGWGSLPYKNVSHGVKPGTYRVTVTVNGKQHYAKTCRDIIEAAKAADKLNMSLRRDTLVPSSLNFPENFEALYSGSL